MVRCGVVRWGCGIGKEGRECWTAVLHRGRDLFTVVEGPRDVRGMVEKMKGLVVVVVAAAAAVVS